ncbi:MAG: YCF48-related protein [Candidatus Eisenbacteria bacterium]
MASWELRSDITTFGQDLYGVHAFSATDLIAVGESPGIFRSTDAGATWTEVPNPSTGTLYQLKTAPDGRLDAAGAQGKVLRSTDDGGNWTDVGPGIGTIECQWWADEMNGWAVGDDVAHHTTDGGASWTQFLDFAFFGYHEVVFYDAMTGEVMEDFSSWQTTDGGVTWNEVQDFSWPDYPRKTLDLGGGHRLRITDLEGAELWETVDGGVTWSQLFAQSTVGMLELERSPSGRIVFSSDVGDLFWSDDEGQTVQNGAARADLFPARIGSLSSTPLGAIHAATEPSSTFLPTSAMKSTDGGHSWFAATPAPPRWTQYSWPSELVGLGAAREELYRTMDGGASWTLANTLSTGNYAPVRTIDGWVYAGTWELSTGAGSLALSTDLGLTWSDVSAGLPSNFGPTILSFLDRETGFALGRLRQGGDVPRVYFTDDAGANWTMVQIPSNDLIAAAHWFSTETGVVHVAGTNPRMYRTTDRGQTWTQVMTGYVSRLAFLGDIGIAVQSFSSQVRYSTDAGVTWNTTSTPMTSRPTNVHATAHEFVLGGDGGQLLRLAPEDVAGLGDDDPSADATDRGFGPELHFAGANPTRGASQLRLLLPAPGRVEVDVIDAAGRHVANLARGFHSAGEFPVTWDGRIADGTAAPSGVYFVRARTEDGATGAARIVRVN